MRKRAGAEPDHLPKVQLGRSRPSSSQDTHGSSALKDISSRLILIGVIGDVERASVAEAEGGWVGGGRRKGSKRVDGGAPPLSSTRDNS